MLRAGNAVFAGRDKSLAPLLSDYLRTAAGKRFEWGRCDCLLFAADWIVRARGVDPAASVRGRYHSRREGIALLSNNGGIERLVSDALANAGMKVTDDPKPGDVALVLAPTADRVEPVGAICVGVSSYAVMTVDCGLVVAPLQPVITWRV